MDLRVRQIITALLTLFLMSMSRGVARAGGLSDALNVATNTASGSGFATTGAPSLVGIVGSFVSVLLGLIGVIFIILIIKAGITWMTAEGNEEKVKQAQTTIKNSVIGLLITFGAYALYIVINTILA